jgi:hypothetical protein
MDHGIIVFGREFDLKAKAPNHLRYRTRVLIRPLGTRRERTIMTIRGVDHAVYTYARDIDLEASAIVGEHAAITVYDATENASLIYLKKSERPFRLLARGGFGEENIREFESPTFAGRYLYFGYSTWRATSTDRTAGCCGATCARAGPSRPRRRATSRPSPPIRYAPAIRS